MVRFAGEFGHGYCVQARGEPSGFWTMIALANQRPVAQFSNVYKSTPHALQDGELFARHALQAYGLRLSDSVEWHEH